MNQLCIIWGYQEELSSTAAGEPYKLEMTFESLTFDERGFRGRAEKIRNKAKACGDLTFEVFLVSVSGF
jgi:hypothetical protein